MSYSELDSTSSRIAAHLLSLGTCPNQIIPLCFSKSRWAVIAIMAVMKSGSAFLLLDPIHQPTDRLMEMIDASLKAITEYEKGSRQEQRSKVTAGAGDAEYAVKGQPTDQDKKDVDG